MREKFNFNADWIFIKEDISLKQVQGHAGEPVTLPHTWNGRDGQDGGGDYYRGRCWYRKDFELSRPQGKEIYLEFNAAASIADVYLNGQKVGHHKGGYSTFRVNITRQVRYDTSNHLVVAVDNGVNDFCYPQLADFTFYGGMYRDVILILVDRTHFDLDYMGGCGVAVTPIVDHGQADVTVDTYLTDPQPGQSIRVQLLDGEGRVVTKEGKPVKDNHFDFEIIDPHLWNGLDDPYLYLAKAQIVNLDGEVLDEVQVKFGIRSFYFDNEKGFYLNGRSYPLRGVSRHQDRPGIGSAISRADHLEDIELIKEMGANSIRLAHYQHDQYFYDLCDAYGMVVWAEIPFISKMLENGNENAISQMKELVIQNYNHPSIVCWGLSNETTLYGVTDELLAIHRELNELVHTLDKSRPTVMAHISMLEIDSPLVGLTDLCAYNHYFGWYGGTVDMNGPWFDHFHKERPDVAVGFSEYGCEAVLKCHTSDPRQGDYSEEYQAHYHEKVLEAIMARPFIWGSYCWNMFDFGSDIRNEGGVPGENHKGLVTFDRKVRKDSFYIHKAHFSKEPFIHITGKRYVERCEEITLVKVYSNQEQVSLAVNGEFFAEKQGSKVFEFSVPLKKGVNQVEARCGELIDRSIIKRVDQPNPDYVFNNGTSTVANWFDREGKKVEFRFPEGYFSIRDKIGDLMKHPQAAALVGQVMQGMASGDSAMGSQFKTSDAMLKMAMAFTIERIALMLGDKIPREMLYALNEKLNKIRKEA